MVALRCIVAAPEGCGPVRSAGRGALPAAEAVAAPREAATPGPQTLNFLIAVLGRCVASPAKVATNR